MSETDSISSTENFDPTLRPRRSKEINKLAAALAKAQGQIENADKDGKGTYGKYATLAATWDVIRKPLSENEIAVYQRIITIKDKPVMATMLIHSSGEFIDDCELELKFDTSGRMNAMQAMGSAVTYARRYSLQAVTGVAPADDDDGAGSGDAKPPQQQSASVKQNPPAKPKVTQPPKKDPDDLDAALGGHPAGSAEAAGLYVIDFGPFKGKKVKDLAALALKAYCGELESKAANDNKTIDPNGSVGKLFEATRIYFGLE